MSQFIILTLIGVGISIGISVIKQNEIPTMVISSCMILALNTTIASIDYFSKIIDTEVYSGKILSVEHNEEYDEWIPPRIETYTTTDSTGKTITETKIIDGYWQHHDATNYIITSDSGRQYVSAAPNGQRFTDSFVNTNEELEQYYPIGQPTASVHTYKNKVQASYSLYKYENINLKEYPNLPDYPKKVNKDFSITRIIGDVPNLESSIVVLNQLNTSLNDTNNPNNIDKIKSYKQCNIIFVNMGEVTEDYGFALERSWAGGKKNDFVIAFGGEDNNINWCYPFSWSEEESLKSDVKSYMLNLKNVDDFVPVIKDIGTMIETKFVRKQFADFDYIQIDLSNMAKTLMFVVILIINIILILM